MTMDAPTMTKAASDMVEVASDMVEFAPDMVESASDMVESASDMVEFASDMVEFDSDMVMDMTPLSQNLWTPRMFCGHIGRGAKGFRSRRGAVIASLPPSPFYPPSSFSVTRPADCARRYPAFA